ncbi:MAG: hypothetical protein K9N47_10280 [Prosthecobacter sp.]|uniref:hypothetical protein n=1 Tax=Prosthecobacter sp. TaxID=1965333 RepID=UPI0025D59D56|nr:hypothetical protein [Prosthecobacter sp.]MCF7786499.1 hypothetical protein [Prosthecobacter sp.]
MTILNLSREDCSHRLDTPYNPPAPSISDQEFDQEYYLLYSKLEEFMAAHGENNAFGQGDYYLEPSIMRSRGIGFEVSNSKIVTTELLQGLQKLAADHAPAWEIYFRSDNFDYDVFINPSAVRIYRNTQDLLPCLDGSV